VLDKTREMPFSLDSERVAGKVMNRLEHYQKLKAEAAGESLLCQILRIGER